MLALQLSRNVNKLARIGRLDILWSVNKLARAVTKSTKACYKRLARLISYMHHTNDHRQYCHVCNTAQRCRFGLFQNSDLARDLEDSKSLSGEFWVSLEGTLKIRNHCRENSVYLWKSNVYPLSPWTSVRGLQNTIILT